MPTSSSALALLLLGALLLVASASSPVAAGDTFGGGGEMVTVRGVARDAGAGGAADSHVMTTAMWQRRRLEDALVPEFPSAAAAGGIFGGPAYRSLQSDRQGCVRQCAAKCAGCPYTRACTYGNHCPQGGN